MPKTARKRENPFLNIVFSMILPSLVLTKLSTPDRLGPVNGLIVALAFPIGFAIYQFTKTKRVSFISGLGFVSILLTGVFALFQLSAGWIAIKEAAIPLVIGLAILLSMRTQSPLVKELLYNDQIINIDRVEEKLTTGPMRIQLDSLLRQASFLIAASLLLSSILNYGLARYLLVSAPGTPEFNAELGRMNYLSWPVIAVPSTLIVAIALIRLLKGLSSLTGLHQDEILNTQTAPKE